MTTQKLKGIIDTWNQKWFSDLEKKLDIKPISAISGELSVGARVYRFFEGKPCHCGHATGLKTFPDQLKHPESGESLAVGAVLDEATPNSDLDVVVAIGINYAQFDASAPKVTLPANWASTEMWRRLGLTLLRLDEECMVGEIKERYGEIFQILDKAQKPFHLVAVNYFPWVTQTEWTEIGLNSIAEALVLRCWGHTHPEERIAGLIKMISEKRPGEKGFCVGEIPFVVFHGANSAVPYLALDTIRLLDGKFFGNFVFCDNLSRKSKPANAVLLLPPTPLKPMKQNSTEVTDD
jgi:hypothetical protein